MPPFPRSELDSHSWNKNKNCIADFQVRLGAQFDVRCSKYPRSATPHGEEGGRVHHDQETEGAAPGHVKSFRKYNFSPNMSNIVEFLASS